MGTKHTPGPWTTEDYVIVDGDGQQIASVLPDYAFEDVSTADARLIAAAPDLLAACKLFMGFHYENCQTGRIQYEQLVEAVKAAIARAEGQDGDA